MSTVKIGPSEGTLTLHTGVEGKAAKMGHALTIQLSDWSAEVEVDDQTPTSVALRAGLSSFEVVKGDGGVKPLSDKDKRTIRESALDTLSANKHPDVTFTSTGVRARSGGWSIDGQLSIAGNQQPATVDLDVADSGGTLTVAAMVPVVQTKHGIKPYSGLMGGLKVSDRVEVRVAATVAKP